MCFICVQDSSDQESEESEDDSISASVYAVHVELFKSKLKDNQFKRVTQVLEGLGELASDAERASMPRKEAKMWKLRAKNFEFLISSIGEKAMQYAKVHFAGSGKIKHKEAERLLKEARSCERTFGGKRGNSDSEQERQFKKPKVVREGACFLCDKLGHMKKDCPINRKWGVIKAPDRVKKCYKCGDKGHLADACNNK